MALNPYFLQGSPGEQNLVQDLINEHLRMFGIEVYYIPRKQLKTDNIIREVLSSKFDDNFSIEVYLNNYEGYSNNSDIMTKFGLTLKNEVSLILSVERFEEFITPFLNPILETQKENPQFKNDVDGGADLVISTRPKEGDLIYFPLGQRIFEIKRVEFESPFYQLGKNYVYELKCELFEYEDELIDTDVEIIQETIKESGYITTLVLSGIGVSAIATPNLTYSTYSTEVKSSVRKVYLTNDGYDYITPPTVTIDPPSSGGQRATAVAITTSINGSNSIKEILLTNCGYGYTVTPKVTITGGGGTGAAATVGLTTNGIYGFNISNTGSKYFTTPNITIGNPNIIGIGTTVAVGVASITSNSLTHIYIRDAGIGYTVAPSIAISPPAQLGIGTYLRNEKIIGSSSNTVAYIKDWVFTQSNDILLKVSINNGNFNVGETVVGSSSSARYTVKSFIQDDLYDTYAENVQIEDNADSILDFSELNPFGNY